VVEALALRREPAAHRAGWSAGRHSPAVVCLEEIVEQLHAAAMELPGLLLTSVEAEGQGRAEREGWILAEIVVARRVPHLHGAALHGVKHLQTGHDFACSNTWM